MHVWEGMGSVMVVQQRSATDTWRQEQVARVLEEAWDGFAHLPERGTWKKYNYLMTRDHAKEEPFAIVEVLGRRVSVHAYDTVPFALKKYKALKRLSADMGLPAMWVVSWWFPSPNTLQAVKWIDLRDLDPSDSDIYVWGHNIPRPGTANDQEKVFDVTIAAMNRVML